MPAPYVGSACEKVTDFVFDFINPLRVLIRVPFRASSDTVGLALPRHAAQAVSIAQIVHFAAYLGILFLFFDCVSNSNKLDSRKVYINIYY